MTRNMTAVPAPLHISARLMAALTIEDVGTLHLHAEHRDAEGRVVYRYVVEDVDGTVLADGTDLSSGVGADTDYVATMGTLISFLTAAAESADYADGTGGHGENADLFPAACVQWAQQHTDELEMSALDLSGDTGE